MTNEKIFNPYTGLYDLDYEPETEPYGDDDFDPMDAIPWGEIHYWNDEYANR